jgi:hypothetical protein
MQINQFQQENVLCIFQHLMFFENDANIDVSMLSNGIYFIQIKTLKTQYYEKFIKIN